MNLGTIVVLALVALLFTPLPRLLIAALFGRQIGAAALARQPATIHLEAMGTRQGAKADKLQKIALEYMSCGFEDAGVYNIPEMKGVRVQLLANPRESMYGAVYEHPQAGVWCDVVSRYADGSSWTFSTARATGLEQRPTARMRNMPGTEPKALIAQSRAERPAFGLKGTSTTSAVADFERAYAEYMTWLKNRGISTKEVVKVARRKVA